MSNGVIGLEGGINARVAATPAVRFWCVSCTPSTLCEEVVKNDTVKTSLGSREMSESGIHLG